MCLLFRSLSSNSGKNKLLTFSTLISPISAVDLKCFLLEVYWLYLSMLENAKSV